MSNYKRIDIPNYLDASISTLIKDIPNIISHNNKENLKLLNSLFNFNDTSSNNESKQYIKTSLHTDGFVIANSGEFKNIKINKIDSSSESNSFVNIVTNHNKSINRFKNELNNSILNEYCHDSDSIYHNGKSLNIIISNIENIINNQNNNNQQIDNNIQKLETKINDLYDNLNINKTFETEQSTYSLKRSLNTNTELYNNDIVIAYNNSSNSYTYPAKVYTGDKSIKYQNIYDNIDIDNNIKFRYYNVNSIYTKVNNQFMNSLNCDKISLQTNIIIDKTHNNDLIIKLSYDGEYYTCIKVLNNDMDLCRLTLTCIDINEYGPKWYLNNYSGNIEFIKIKNNQ